MYRVGQGLAYLRPKRSRTVDTRLRELLRPEEFALIERLSLSDRVHHLNVYVQLLNAGFRNQYLLKAALLHDVGKVDGRARVGLMHRTLAVLLRASAPTMFERLAKPDGGRWRRGLFLTRAHPALGAHMAQWAGCSERVCWLIAHHHDEGSTDEDLRILQRADDGRLR